MQKIPIFKPICKGPLPPQGRRRGGGPGGMRGGRGGIRGIKGAMAMDLFKKIMITGILTL